MSSRAAAEAYDIFITGIVLICHALHPYYLILVLLIHICLYISYQGLICQVIVCLCLSSKIVSYIQAQKFIVRGCLAYLSFIHNIVVDPPSMDSILVICEVLDAFPTDLPGVLLMGILTFL